MSCRKSNFMGFAVFVLFWVYDFYVYQVYNNLLILINKKYNIKKGAIHPIKLSSYLY